MFLTWTDLWKYQSRFFRVVPRFFLLRVWSWLRMNAGDVDQACKSYGHMSSDMW